MSMEIKMEDGIYTTANAPRYRQLSKIARGSFGTVYRVKLRGRDARTVYAMKKIALGPGKGNSARREINSLSSMPIHKNVVSMFEYFIEDGMLNVVMELCDIGNLNSFMCIYGANDELLTSFMKDMVDGLTHLHKHNIIHGDIKPANILLCTQSYAYPRCKLADFGVSRFSGDGKPVHLNYLRENRESLYFAAPEVFNEGIVTQKSDVFSLGVVFYALHSLEGLTSNLGMLAPTVDGHTLFWQSNNRYIEGRIRCHVKDTVKSSMVVSMIKSYPGVRHFSSLLLQNKYFTTGGAETTNQSTNSTMKRLAEDSEATEVSPTSIKPCPAWNVPSPPKKSCPAWNVPSPPKKSCPAWNVPSPSKKPCPDLNVPFSSKKPCPESNVPSLSEKHCIDSHVPFPSKTPCSNSSVPISKNLVLASNVPSLSKIPCPDLSVPSPSKKTCPDISVPSSSEKPCYEPYVPSSSTKPRPDSSVQSPSKIRLSNSSVQSPSKIRLSNSSVQSPSEIRLSNSSVQSPSKIRLSNSSVQSPSETRLSNSSVQSPSKIRLSNSSVQSPSKIRLSNSSVQSPSKIRLSNSSVQSPSKNRLPNSSVQSPSKNRLSDSSVPISKKLSHASNISSSFKNPCPNSNVPAHYSDRSNSARTTSDNRYSPLQVNLIVYFSLSVLLACWTYPGSGFLLVLLIKIFWNLRNVSS